MLQLHQVSCQAGPPIHAELACQQTAPNCSMPARPGHALLGLHMSHGKRNLDINSHSLGTKLCACDIKQASVGSD